MEQERQGERKRRRRRKRWPSRADRFAGAISDVETAKATVEELRDELQSWLDNMPENLQQSEKAQNLEAAISELDGIVDNLDEAVSAQVDFPGMY